MSFDLQKIKYFLAVFEHGKISSAAEELRVSQPTLSRQILALEQQFDAPLFVRHGRGVIPTEAGKRLEQGLQQIFDQLRVLKNDVAAVADEPSGEVAFGFPPSPRIMLIVPIIEALCSTYPRVAVRLCEQTSGDIRDLVAKAEIDLAIINLDEPLQGLNVQRLASEPMLLVGPHSARLSLDQPAPIEKLEELPLILTSSPNSLRRIVEKEMNRHGLRPRVLVQANTLPLITDLVAQGLGFTVLPSCGALSLVKSKCVSASPLRGMSITWALARPANLNLSIAASSLVNIVFQVVYDQVNGGNWPMAKLELDCRRGARNSHVGGLGGQDPQLTDFTR